MNFVYFFKILYFLSNGYLNIPEYRRLLNLIGRVQYLYIIEHAVENINYHRFQSISVTLLSLDFPLHCRVDILSCFKQIHWRKNPARFKIFHGIWQISNQKMRKKISFLNIWFKVRELVYFCSYKLINYPLEGSHPQPSRMKI